MLADQSKKASTRKAITRHENKCQLNPINNKKSIIILYRWTNKNGAQAGIYFSSISHTFYTLHTFLYLYITFLRKKKKEREKREKEK
jgi:hypothetical protein